MSRFLRTFRELQHLETFEERFDYLSLRASVGASTFAGERYLNQAFYASREWKQARDIVIVRDGGFDLGIPGREVRAHIIVHHMNPITIEDIERGNPDILDPDLLITTCHDTHNAIHYGDRRRLKQPYVERKPGDTLLWTPFKRRNN